DVDGDVGGRAVQQRDEHLGIGTGVEREPHFTVMAVARRRRTIDGGTHGAALGEHAAVAHGKVDGIGAVVVGQAATCGADHADVEGAGGARVSVHTHVVRVAHNETVLGQDLIAVREEVV